MIESKENLTESSTAPSTAPSDAPSTAPFSQPLDRGEVKPGAPADKPDASGQNFTTPTRN